MSSSISFDDRRGRSRAQLRIVFVAAVVLVAGACAVTEGLDPQRHFGTQPTLPQEVSVPQDFRREADGFANDIPAAFDRYYACVDDVGEALGDPGLATMAPDDRQLYALLCSEAAGNGWEPGNRRDEARLLNQQALDTTHCLRDLGWDYPDPVPERHGRYLEVMAPGATGLDTEDPSLTSVLVRDVSRCMEDHAVDWSAWVIENPRS